MNLLASGRSLGLSARRARLDTPRAVAVDSTGMVFIADTGAHGIWKVDSAGAISLLGDKKRVAAARLETTTEEDPWIAPASVATDPKRYLVVVDSAHSRVCYVDAEGTISILAGSGKAGFAGDGGPAIDALLAGPSGVAVDRAGNVFIADTGNNRIRRVEAYTGVILTVAGNGSPGFSGDGGPATSASLMSPQGLAVDSEGHLWIADTGNNRIRRVEASSGVINTVVGNGGLGFAGDGGPAMRASLADPAGVAVDGDGNLFIADSYNQRVRRVDSTSHIITTVAGDGSSGFSPDGELATDAALSNPTGVALDVDDNLYIAESEGHRVRRVDSRTGVITTVAGNASGGDDSVNQPPVADAGPDRALECTSPDGTLVLLDGSASSDPDGDPLSFTWSGPFLKPRGAVTGIEPQVMLPLGKSVLKLVVNDGELVSQPAFATVEITVRPQPAGPALASLVPEGSSVPLSDQIWNRGTDLPLELRLFCGSRALGEGDVAPPRIVTLAGDDGPIPLASLCAAQGRAEATCLLFHYSRGNWVYDLKTADLKRGTYLVTIQIPDARRFCGGFVLR